MILPELEEAVVIIMMDHTHVPVLELVTSSLHETEKMTFIYVVPPQSWGDQRDTKHSNASS